MAHFVIIGKDKPNTLDKRLAARPEHVARLKALHADGRVVSAGFIPADLAEPTAGVEGSVLVLEFASRAELDGWLADEPYVLDGVYESVTVYPYQLVLHK